MSRRSATRSITRSPWLLGVVIVTAVACVTMVATDSVTAKYVGNDGDWIAFEHASGGQSDILVANIGGPGFKVTDSAATEGRPAWDHPPADAGCLSSQHHRLAFESREPGGKADIFHVEIGDLDAVPPAPAPASAPVNITASSSADDTSHAWSPYNYFQLAEAGPVFGLIAFTSDRDVNQDGRTDRDIFIVDETGAYMVNVTHDDADDANPEWSPDGSQLAFESTRSGSRQIWTVPIQIKRAEVAVGAPFAEVAVGAPYQVTHGPDPKHEPTWIRHTGGDEIPQEQMIYSVAQGGRSYLDTISQDILFAPFSAPAPVVVQELTGDPGNDSSPSWASGAHAVVYATTAGSATSSLTIMRGDPTRPLTFEPGPVVSPSGNDTNPDWQPRRMCADPHARMPAPAPPTRTPAPSGDNSGAGAPAAGSGGGDSGAGGTVTGSGAGSAGGGRTAPAALALRRVIVTTTGRGAQRRVVVSLTVNKSARATLRLTRGRIVIAPRSYGVHAGQNRLLVRVPRRARRGLYRVTVRGQAQETRTVVRRVRLGR